MAETKAIIDLAKQAQAQFAANKQFGDVLQEIFGQDQHAPCSHLIVSRPNPSTNQFRLQRMD